MIDVTPEALNAARRIVPQHITCGSIHMDTSLWNRLQFEVEQPTLVAARIIQEAIDAVIARQPAPTVASESGEK